MNTQQTKRTAQIVKLSLVDLHSAIRKEEGHIKVLNKKIARLTKNHNRLSIKLQNKTITETFFK